MNDIKIVLVDDDKLIVDLLEGFLQSQEGLDIIFTANSAEDFFEKIKTEPVLPEIVITDLKMKEISGVELTGFIKDNHPEMQTIVMSSHYNKSFMGFMLKTGASAFVPKGITPIKIVEIIREVHKKGVFFLEDQLEIIREQLSSKAPQPILDQANLLTDREIEVLKLICEQKTAKDIGEVLFIAQRTVEGHKNSILLKTGASNVAGLVIYAIQQKIINVDDFPMLV